MTKVSIHIGINYKRQSCELRGCINDANNLFKKYTSMGYTGILITDSDISKFPPTKKNIVDCITKTILSLRSGDTLFISYSGHGTLQRDISGDEPSGYDQAICPVDMNKSGVIVDDDLFKILNKAVSGSTIVCLFDCCHSGTILDLRFNYSSESRHYIDSNIGTITKAKVVLFSGCKDDQTSADTFMDGAACGALTWAFLKELNGSVRIGSVMIDNIARSLKRERYSQIPRLSCGNSQLTGYDNIIF